MTNPAKPNEWRAPQPKRAWRRPMLKRLEAGCAELNVGAIDDGVDKS